MRAFIASEGLYRYQDEQGTTQVVNSVDHIPERYRERARSVKAKVSVQAAPKPPPPAPSVPLAASPDKPSGPDGKPPRALPSSSSKDPISKDPINEARETVEKVQEIRREQERVLETLH